jgi:hypothetical protein
MLLTLALRNIWRIVGLAGGAPADISAIVSTPTASTHSAFTSALACAAREPIVPATFPPTLPVTLATAEAATAVPTEVFMVEVKSPLVGAFVRLVAVVAVVTVATVVPLRPTVVVGLPTLPQSSPASPVVLTSSVRPSTVG